jgi:ABC-type polar amino acid transport system ATPase subunit
MNATLAVRGLELRRGNREILRGVDFEIRRGEVVALMGLSGSGKTTVLRAIAGLEAVGRGAAVISGGSDARVGFVFQFHCLFEHLTVIENICLAPVHVHGAARHDALAKAARLLEELGIGHRAAALPRELSGGEAQRAAIARALAVDPPLLLLDEPTASLDPPRRASLGALLRQLASSDRAILLTSHDVDFVREHATRVLILSDGAVVESGDPIQVFDAPAHDATRELLETGVPKFRGSEVPGF